MANKENLSRRNFLKLGGIALGTLFLPGCLNLKDSTPTIDLKDINLTKQQFFFTNTEGQIIMNEGNFLPMKEIATENGTLIIPTDKKIAKRLDELHQHFPPIQGTVWQQTTNSIVEATAGDQQQHYVLLQLWGNQTTSGEWSTLLFPGDSVQGEGLNGTAFAYPSYVNPDGSYLRGWNNDSVVVDVLAGIARRARFTQIAPVSTPYILGKPQASGLISLEDTISRGWLRKR